MSMRMKEILVLAVTLVLTLIAYLAKVNGMLENGLQFSMTMSFVVIILIAASLAWILVLTLKGHLIERRVVFLYIGVAVILPFFMPFSQDIRVSQEVRAIYDDVMSLPAGSRVLISFDYDPPSAPELQPMAESFMRLCLLQDLRLIIIGLWPQGPQQANLAFDKILIDPEIVAKNPQYGKDYVNLGFQTGNEFVIQRLGSSFESMFPTDFYGTNYSELPLVKNVKNFSNIDYSYNLSAGFPGTKEWVQVAVDRYGLKLAAGNTAVQAPMIYPYFRAGQLSGLQGGMNGGAEFEILTGYKGKATTFMNSQSFAHLVVIAFIFIGNVAFFRSGRKTRL